MRFPEREITTPSGFACHPSTEGEFFRATRPFVPSYRAFANPLRRSRRDGGAPMPSRRSVTSLPQKTLSLSKMFQKHRNSLHFYKSHLKKSKKYLKIHKTLTNKA
jgi:hypothetical protein